jgi:hypothetical protein
MRAQTKKGDYMRNLSYLTSLIFIALLFALFGCASSTNLTAYPNPTTATASPSATPLPATPTFIGKWKTNTPKPISTRAVNLVMGDLASLASKDVLNYSNEELFKLLMGQWLEKHKTGVIPTDTIKDYKVDKVTIDQVNESKVVAWIDFSIQPVEHLSNWSVITMRFADSNDPWDHIGGLFAIYREGEYILLRWQTI